MMRTESWIFLLGIVFVPFSDAKRNGQKLRLKNQGTCHLEVTCDGGVSLPLRLPLRGPRGPPGAPGAKGDRGEKGERGSPGVPGESGNVIAGINKRMEHVAFFAGLESNINGLQNDEDARFGNVVTNIGNCYDPITGRFRAPVDGVYQFYIAVAAQGRHKAAVDLVTSLPELQLQNTTKTLLESGQKPQKFNGNWIEPPKEQMIIRVWAESLPLWSTATNTAIVSLRQGQQVWLRILKRASYLHGYMYSSFSGAMLFPDDM